MNTWVLCLSRLKAFEWTIRSRSRWNGVRMTLSGSGSRRIARYDGVALSHRYSRSQARTRSSSDLAEAAATWLAAPDTRKRIGSADARNSPGDGRLFGNWRTVRSPARRPRAQPDPRRPP